MERQERKLTAAMSVIVKGLLHLEALIPAVRELGRRHSGYGVQWEHYGTVGEALVWALNESLDQDFTPEVREAWVDTYAHLAEVMKNASGSSPAAAAV
jgi:hemoglobin-like flavoprotein